MNYCQNTPGQEALGPGLLATRTRFAGGTELSEHAHEGATLSIPFQGTFLEVYGRREQEIDPSRALYKSPGFRHKNLVGPEGFDGVLVEISGDRHDWIEAATGSIGADQLLCDSLSRPLLRAFRWAWQSEAPGKALHLESLVLQILGRLGSRNTTSQRPRWLGSVIERLRDAFPERPTLDELARSARVHPVHLAQVFRRHEGCSVGAYVERLRIDAVCTELTEGDLGLAELAATTGFADQSHMTRVFRRMLGTTPARFRRTAPGRGLRTLQRPDGPKRVQDSTDSGG